MSHYTPLKFYDYIKINVGDHMYFQILLVKREISKNALFDDRWETIYLSWGKDAMYEQHNS